MFQSILTAIDGSPDAERALVNAAQLARLTNARLTIMTVVPDPSAWLLTGGAYAAIDLDAINHASESEHRELVNRAAETVTGDVSVTTLICHGRPGQQIVKQLHKGHHDLVVLGSRGRGEVRSLLLGSVSHEVLSHSSDTAVLIVRASED
jgi:nucleotide-binding universal stress UspA family protein